MISESSQSRLHTESDCYMLSNRTLSAQQPERKCKSVSYKIIQMFSKARQSARISISDKGTLGTIKKKYTRESESTK